MAFLDIILVFGMLFAVTTTIYLFRVTYCAWKHERQRIQHIMDVSKDW